MVGKIFIFLSLFILHVIAATPYKQYIAGNLSSYDLVKRISNHTTG